jgi:hypothetical protein
MNVEDRLNFATKFLDEHCLEVLRTKGREYTGGSKDALSNFKDISRATGVPPVTVAYTFLFKHLASIASYVKDRNSAEPPELSEPIESRLGDAINYLLIIGALIDEERRDGTERIEVTAYGDAEPQYLEVPADDCPAVCEKDARVNPSLLEKVAERTDREDGVTAMAETWIAEKEER